MTLLLTLLVAASGASNGREHWALPDPSAGDASASWEQDSVACCTGSSWVWSVISQAKPSQHYVVQDIYVCCVSLVKLVVGNGWDLRVAQGGVRSYGSGAWHPSITLVAWPRCSNANEDSFGTWFLRRQNSVIQYIICDSQ